MDHVGPAVAEAQALDRQELGGSLPAHDAAPRLTLTSWLPVPR